MGDSRYTRTIMYMGKEMMRPLDGGDAESLMGAELVVHHHGVQVPHGVVTSVKVVDDGQRLEVVAESGGRGCPACGQVYSEGEAAAALRVLHRLLVLTPPPDVAIYRGVPPWVRVCSDPLACLGRVVQAKAAAG